MTIHSRESKRESWVSEPEGKRDSETNVLLLRRVEGIEIVIEREKERRRPRDVLIL